MSMRRSHEVTEYLAPTGVWVGAAPWPAVAERTCNLRDAKKQATCRCQSVVMPHPSALRQRQAPPLGSAEPVVVVSAESVARRGRDRHGELIHDMPRAPRLPGLASYPPPPNETRKRAA